MPKITVWTVIKLAIACLLVGLVMSVLGLGPSDILGSGKRIVDWFIKTFAGFVSGPVPASCSVHGGFAVVDSILSQGGSKSQLTILDRRDENFRTLKARLSSVGVSPVSRRCPRRTRGLHPRNSASCRSETCLL